LSKKTDAGSITILDFKLYYRAITIKTAWFWHKNRQEDQWIRIEEPDISPLIYSQEIFDKGAQNTMEKRQPLQLILLGKLYIHMQKIETKSLSLTLYQNQLKVD
jgi:hypothetical protein